MLIAASWMFALLSMAAGGFGFACASVGTARRHAIVRRFHESLADASGNTGLKTAIMGALERLGRKIERRSATAQTRALLMRAGFFAPSAVYVFAALRFVAADLVAFVAMAFCASRYGFSAQTMLVTCGVGFLGYRLGITLLKIRAERRAADIRRELPHALDLILMVLDSGVSIDQCLRYSAGVFGKTAPGVAAVLKRYVADVDSGVPYESALERFGQRLGVEEGHDLASIVKQAMLQGGELGPTLKRFAVDLTDKRLALAREIVGRKSILLTLVMLAFFMPVLMTVLAGPAVADLIGTLGTASKTIHQNRVHR